MYVRKPQARVSNMSDRPRTVESPEIMIYAEIVYHSGQLKGNIKAAFP